MHPETYTRFYILVVIALVVGFIGMEVATTGISIQDEQVSGMATRTIDGTEPALGSGTPGSNLIFFLIGILAGAVIVGTAIYIYKVERKRIV